MLDTYASQLMAKIVPEDLLGFKGKLDDLEAELKSLSKDPRTYFEHRLQSSTSFRPMQQNIPYAMLAGRNVDEVNEKRLKLGKFEATRPDILGIPKDYSVE